MAIIAWPSAIVPNGIDWDWPDNDIVQRSSVNGATKVLDFGPAERLTARFAFPQFDEAKQLAFQAFAAQLRGAKNSFRYPLVERDQHALTLTVQVNGTTGGGATSLVLKGLPNSTTLLAAGRAITVTLANGDEQPIPLAGDLISNGSGIATATLGTPLRYQANANAAVETKRPWALLRARNPRAWSVTTGLLYSRELTAEEAF